MKRFLFYVNNNDDDIGIYIECIDGHIQIISEYGEGNATTMPLLTSEQSRAMAMTLIEMAAEADGQIAAEICDL